MTGWSFYTPSPGWRVVHLLRKSPYRIQSFCKKRSWSGWLSTGRSFTEKKWSVHLLSQNLKVKVRCIPNMKGKSCMATKCRWTNQRVQTFPVDGLEGKNICEWNFGHNVAENAPCACGNFYACALTRFQKPQQLGRTRIACSSRHVRSEPGPISAASAVARDFSDVTSSADFWRKRAASHCVECMAQLSDATIRAIVLHMLLLTAMAP